MGYGTRGRGRAAAKNTLELSQEAIGRASAHEGVDPTGLETAVGTEEIIEYLIPCGDRILAPGHRKDDLAGGIQFGGHTNDVVTIFAASGEFDETITPVQFQAAGNFFTATLCIPTAPIVRGIAQG